MTIPRQSSDQVTKGKIVQDSVTEDQKITEGILEAGNQTTIDYYIGVLLESQAILLPKISLTSHPSASSGCFHVWRGGKLSANASASNYGRIPCV